MPLIKVQTNVSEVSGHSSELLLRGLSQLLAEVLEKSEDYVMTVLEPQSLMTFGGSPEPASYMEIKNIGTMTSEQTQRISAAACALVKEHLGVEPGRVYLEFNDAQRHLWGWNSKNFA
ncbi:MAG: hypothetical protein HOI23_23450 [Deltaproteobacteria bacterium]|jgi:phenylpyruvate tautomerase|nr:hypothetical protein [Deltaproteobacteria bacterium]MBT6434697.1 hypothetical protein [Deltaproteobacteria bacterium]MBT6492760.1 hypothetical protein [Deltaproteobacteria bacterium]